MKQHRFLPYLWLLTLVLWLLIGCASEPTAISQTVETRTETVIQTRVVEVGGETIVEEVQVTRIVSVEAFATGSPVTNPGSQVANSSPLNQPAPQRLIIKDGRMVLQVLDADAAAQQAINHTIELGGYIISQRVWTGERGYRFARIQAAVPVHQFENALSAFRTLGTVMDESATGQDVTDEYVDLNSHLGNLYATQEQYRVFLGQATNISETLRVYNELVKVETEINAIQGRINYLSDRAAFSTISLNIDPLIPTPTPTPTATPTPTPTPTPLPTPDTWRPGDTAQTALVQLQNTAQKSADFSIYNSIICGPWLLAAALLFFLVRWIRVRVRGQL